ncbi:metal-dependent hydrolase [Natronolimnohabitans innermongolicus]|uniref:Membrane-bound metal-dependent hydrolase n=1 Tax=Natronolimnohabitans innermongolicus JCM 12255 TaxID=1227499 RepID=L9X9X5_9EURY|nr:metal-dependent hydrolase [Natronolimnohabitans innermongolicus]ELY57433.1 membrane-bound metal-dependent hydrolase [Natronolimnohabitans innermongolicus JCM 12255]
MPSVLVHVAFAGLLGTALLGERFDGRAIAIVMVASASIDLDTLVGLVFPGAHRALFHNIWIVLIPAVILYWDVTRRETSFVLERWGPYGYRVAWVTLVTVLFAHILLDAFYSGVNILWPLHDQFYDLSGKLVLSTERGIVQTFVEFDAASGTLDESTVRGSTEETYYSTGFNPTPGESSSGAERTFPVAETGEQLVLVVASLGTVAYRLLETERADDE